MSVARIEQTKCNLCGERLTDPESIKRGIGPVCAKNTSKFLAAVGTSAEEVAALALVDDSAVARYLRVSKKAFFRDGREDIAKRFLEAARAAARLATAEIVEAQAA
jgi:hypothetical protein